MAFRDDISVDWTQSPRIVTVAAPSTDLSIQDLHDTLSTLQVHPAHGLSYPRIVDTSGKEDLGGGSLVGLTLVLEDARIRFESRTVSSESGTATSADADGLVLVDTSADFVAAGVEPGDTIMNLADGSVSTVTHVANATTLWHDPLNDGTSNTWQVGDDYKVWPEEVCEASGGNLVAVDANGNSIYAVHSSFGTLAIITRSSGAVIAQLQISQLVERIESLRASHRGTGELYYWDPVNGDDANDGTSDSSAIATFAKAQTMCVAYNHDVIQALPGNTTDWTTTAENINITVPTLSLRGPGIGSTFTIEPQNNTLPTVSIGVPGVALQGVRVDGDIGGSATAVISANNADSLLIEDVLCSNSPGHGISVTNTDLGLFRGVVSSNNVLHGILIGDGSINFSLENCEPHDNGGTGIRLDGASIRDCHIVGAETVSYGNEIGLYIGSSVVGTQIHTDSTITNNTTRDIDDNGINTNYSGTDHAAAFDGKVSIDSVNGESGTAYPRGTPGRPSNNLVDLRAIADYWGFNELYADGDIVLGSSVDWSGWTIAGKTHIHSSVTIEDSADVNGVYFRDILVTGTLDGNNEFVDCLVSNISYVSGDIHDSGLTGTIALAGAADARIVNCYTTNPFDPPVIDMGVSGQNLSMPGYSGLLTITNFNGPLNFAGVGLQGGQVNIDSTSVTAGFIHVSGVGVLLDENNVPIRSGVWNGGVVIVNETVGSDSVARAVWSARESDYESDAGSFGQLIQRVVGLQKENYVMDELVYNGDSLLTSARVRLFHTNTAANAATSGGVGEGEYSTYTFSTTPLVANPQLPEIIRSTKEP